MAMPRMRLTGVVLDSPNARDLASFYRRLLGWEAVKEEPNWVKLSPGDGGPGLSFQSEPEYVRPTWPSKREHQQMMLHLDIEVEDLAASAAHAIGCGATLADFQPQQRVRVFLDPAGHPFCLWVRG